MSRVKHHIPLFQVLKELKPYQRQIILDHLDNTSCKSVASCVASLLKKSSKVSPQQKKAIALAVKAQKNHFEKIISPGKNSKQLKKDLTRVGGGPLGLILGAAIPLLVDLIARK